MKRSLEGRAEGTQTKRTPLYENTYGDGICGLGKPQGWLSTWSMKEESALYGTLPGNMITGQKETKSRKETLVPLYTDTHTQLQKDPYKLLLINTQAGVNRTIHTLYLLIALLLNWQLIKIWMWVHGSNRDYMKTNIFGASKIMKKTVQSTVKITPLLASRKGYANRKKWQ